MNEPQLFNFEGNDVRTLNHDEQIWFAAPDVTKALKLTNTTVALKSLDGDEVTKFNLGAYQARLISSANQGCTS